MPTPMDTAREFIAHRVLMPQGQGRVPLALDPAFPAAVRQQALFVTKCSSANALEGLRQSIQGVLDGQVDPATAASRLRASFGEGEAAGALWNRDATEALIRQQAMMAYAVGQHQLGTDPAVQDEVPFWRYVATHDRRTRPTHAELDGTVLPKNDPFWAAHTPPWDYGCRCSLIDVRRDDPAAAQVATAQTTELPNGTQSALVQVPDAHAAKIGLPPGGTLAVPAPQSGFRFDPTVAFAQSDMGQVKNLKSRQDILEELITAAQQSQQPWRFVTTSAGPEQITLPPNHATITAELRAALTNIPPAGTAGRPAAQTRLSLGPVPAAAADGLGIRPEQAELVLASPGTKEVGMAHWAKNHAAVMADPARAVDLLNHSLWDAGSRWWIDVKAGGNVYLAAGNLKQDAMVVFRRFEQDGPPEWRLDLLSTFQPDNSEGSYMDRLPGAKP